MAKPQKPNKDQIQLGQTVVDFVNAETTDAACSKHFENMRKLIPFDAKFIETMKDTFPFLNTSLGSLSESEREIFELLVGEKSKKEEIAKKLDFLGYTLDDYDPQNETVEVSKDYITGSGFNGTGEFDVEYEQYEPETMPLDSFKWNLLHESDEQMGALITSKIENLMEIGKSISELEGSISVSRFHLIHNSWERYLGIEKLHLRIEELQTDLQKLLDGIAKNKCLADLTGIHLFVPIYNELEHSIVVVQEDLLQEISPIRAESYFNIREPHVWFSRFETDLAYCLIGFLKAEGNRNYIKKCSVSACEDFFIAEDIRRKVCYPPKNCQKIAEQKYDTSYKQLDRWDRFVYDVKEKCKTIDDLYNNPKLLNRARRFRFGLDGVIERLKEIL